MKAVVAAFNQEKALVGAFSVITNLRMELFQALSLIGQGTIGLELLEQVPDLDLVLVPISGGGMTAGIATAVKTINPKCKVKSL